MSAIEDRRNLDFLPYDVLKIESLFRSKLFEHCYGGTVAAIFYSAQTRAEQKYHPCAAAIYANEPRFEHGKVIMPTEAGEAILAYAQVGFFRRSSGSVGGMQLHYVVTSTVNRMFMAANVGLANYAMRTTANAKMLQEFGSDAHARRAVAS